MTGTVYDVSAEQSLAARENTLLAEKHLEQCTDLQNTLSAPLALHPSTFPPPKPQNPPTKTHTLTHNPSPIFLLSTQTTKIPTIRIHRRRHERIRPSPRDLPLRRRRRRRRPSEDPHLVIQTQYAVIVHDTFAVPHPQEWVD